MKPVNKNQTFENFSVNDGNAWALAALKTVLLLIEMLPCLVQQLR